jgi:hypothetical protein
MSEIDLHPPARRTVLSRPSFEALRVNHRPRRWRTHWICIACHCLPLAVVMPRRVSAPGSSARR